MKAGSAAEKGGITIGDRLITVNEVECHHNHDHNHLFGDHNHYLDNYRVFFLTGTPPKSSKDKKDQG